MVGTGRSSRGSNRRRTQDIPPRHVDRESDRRGTGSNREAIGPGRERARDAIRSARSQSSRTAPSTRRRRSHRQRPRSPVEVPARPDDDTDGRGVEERHAAHVDHEIGVVERDRLFQALRERRGRADVVLATNPDDRPGDGGPLREHQIVGKNDRGRLDESHGILLPQRLGPSFRLGSDWVLGDIARPLRWPGPGPSTTISPAGAENLHRIRETSKCNSGIDAMFTLDG